MPDAPVDIPFDQSTLGTSEIVPVIDVPVEQVSESALSSAIVPQTVEQVNERVTLMQPLIRRSCDTVNPRIDVPLGTSPVSLARCEEHEGCLNDLSNTRAAVKRASEFPLHRAYSLPKRDDPPTSLSFKEFL